MKKLVAIIFLICLTTLSYGQARERADRQYEKIAGDYKIPGVKMKKIGSYVIIGGAACIIGGVVKIASADKTRSTYINPSTGNTYYVYHDHDITQGILFILAGVAITTPGVILYTIGTKRSNKYIRKMTVGYQGTGLSVKLKI